MSEEHAWARISHDSLHPVAMVLVVAVYRTLCAGWLVIYERARFKAPVGVFQQLKAFAAGTLLAGVVSPAVHTQHGLDRLLLPTQPSATISHSVTTPARPTASIQSSSFRLKAECFEVRWPKKGQDSAVGSQRNLLCRSISSLVNHAQIREYRRKIRQISALEPFDVRGHPNTFP